MFYRTIRILLIASTMLLLIGIAQPLTAQTTSPSSVNVTPATPAAGSDCDQMLAKTLADLDAKDIQLKSRDEQIVNFKERLAKQDERFVEVLKILQEYAGLDSKQKKGFWATVKKKLVGFIDEVTEPSTLKEIMLIITLIRAGK